ncbi:unnamed protein product [Notodromas monacha]|uniref:EGF-like domain-containing protein n=1 Tax=Notodromas monacha TaxID=399045 RepID=A0A7R9BDY1_9CRUS|nr:unnamed protein product [Notodromas monacha]CAG0913617.1 unnamed protein product [Notodromas monacha]
MLRLITSWSSGSRQVVDGCVEREGSHFKCNGNAERVCEIGWTGDMCDVPICRPGCDPLHGYCHKPGECVCKLGWRGDLCNECMTLPGCIHGTCDVTWECNCKPGWDGLFCNQPKCKEGCHTTRGYCEKPEECNLRRSPRMNDRDAGCQSVAITSRQRRFRISIRITHTTQNPGRDPETPPKSSNSDLTRVFDVAARFDTTSPPHVANNNATLALSCGFRE